MPAVRLRQPKHLTPPKSHQRRCVGDLDPAIRQILQYAHPVDLRPAHRNHRHRPNAPQLKLRRVTSLSRPTVTSLSGVYNCLSRNERLWNASYNAIDFNTGASRFSPPPWGGSKLSEALPCRSDSTCFEVLFVASGPDLFPRLSQTFKFIQTAFGSVKFSIAAVPCSRPKPETRTAPHGNRTSV